MTEKIILPNFHGLDHQKCIDHFEGDLTYLGDFVCTDNSDHPHAVFHNANPNREKNHKDFMLLGESNGQMYVAGRDMEQMKPYLTQAAVQCIKCEEIIYSLHRHDMRWCSCKSIAIDGGRQYTKLTGDLAHWSGIVDFFNKTFRILP